VAGCAGLAIVGEVSPRRPGPRLHSREAHPAGQGKNAKAPPRAECQIRSAHVPDDIGRGTLWEDATLPRGRTAEPSVPREMSRQWKKQKGRLIRHHAAAISQLERPHKPNPIAPLNPAPRRLSPVEIREPPGVQSPCAAPPISVRASSDLRVGRYPQLPQAQSQFALINHAYIPHMSKRIPRFSESPGHFARANFKLQPSDCRPKPAAGPIANRLCPFCVTADERRVKQAHREALCASRLRPKLP